MKIVTFLLKNGDLPKRVVDFPLERDTFLNKIMEIVDDKNYNNDGKPWKSSRSLRVKLNFFMFHFFIKLGHTFHDLDRVSDQQPLRLSGLSLDRERPIEAHTLASTVVKASHSARGSDIRMESRQESAPRPFTFPLLLCHIPHRHPRFPGRG